MRSLHLDEIGEVTLRKNRQNRNLKITIRPYRPVLVSMPHHVSFARAEEFLLSKSGWIIKQLKKLEENHKATTPVGALRTARRNVELVANAKLDPVKIALPVSVSRESIKIEHPPALNPEEPPLRDIILDVVAKTLRKEAREILPPLVEKYAKRHGFDYKRVALNHAKTRWGSCSAKNNINLNITLALLPERLMHYVVLHELAHTKEANHGPGFWRLLEKICPGAKKLDKELKAYSPSLWGIRRQK